MKRNLLIGLTSLVGLGVIIIIGIITGIIDCPAPPPPVDVRASNLIIRPSEVEPGERVTITVAVRNVGATEATDYGLCLRIDGELEPPCKYFGLDAGETTTISFAVERDIEGSYSVELAGLIGVFQVIAPEPAKVEARVTRVIDGDTIEVSLRGQIYKVRYIGIDTPETVHPSKPVQCFGKEASAKNSELVAGKVVRLEKDVSETDRYGRLLRYVWVGDTLVNDYLVRQGYAYASTYPPDVKYADRFAQAQREARQNNRGLWAVCG